MTLFPSANILTRKSLKLDKTYKKPEQFAGSNFSYHKPRIISTFDRCMVVCSEKVFAKVELNAVGIEWITTDK